MQVFGIFWGCGKCAEIILSNRMDPPPRCLKCKSETLTFIRMRPFHEVPKGTTQTDALLVLMNRARAAMIENEQQISQVEELLKAFLAASKSSIEKTS